MCGFSSDSESCMGERKKGRGRRKEKKERKGEKRSEENVKKLDAGNGVVLLRRVGTPVVFFVLSFVLSFLLLLFYTFLAADSADHCTCPCREGVTVGNRDAECA
jgi:hypothetical protein